MRQPGQAARPAGCAADVRPQSGCARRRAFRQQGGLGLGDPEARCALARSGTQLDYYANAAWSDRLPDLVQTALLAGFEASGRIDAVSRDDDGLHSDYQLSTDLRDFEARYATANGVPNVAVTIIAHMSDTRSRKILANLSVNLTEPASANSVDPVVQALNTALAKAVNQIVQWALALPPPADAAPEPPRSRTP